MIHGRGRESKNVAGPVLEKEPLSVEGDWRPVEGSDGTSGNDDEVRIRRAMVAKDLTR